MDSVTKYPRAQLKHKSAGEQARDDFIGWIVACITIYLILAVFKILFIPFKYIFMTDEQRLKEKIEKARDKVALRERRNQQLRIDPDFMLNKVLDYELTSVKEDNSAYNEFIEAYKNGTLIDSYLWYAPEVYVEDPYSDSFVEKIFNKDFLVYLKNQVNLHTELSFAERHAFISTIRKYFPEFTPRLSVILAEIETSMEEVKVVEARCELRQAIRKVCFLPGYADELLQEKNPEKLKKNLGIFTLCKSLNLSVCIAMFCVRTKINPEDIKPELVETVELAEQQEIPEIGVALIKGKIDMIELAEFFAQNQSHDKGVVRMMFTRYIKNKTLTPAYKG